MKTFYSIKNDFQNIGYYIKEWLCAAFFLSYNESVVSYAF